MYVKASFLPYSTSNKQIDLAIVIIRDILYRYIRCRFFVQPLNRHNGEDLVNGP